MNKEIIKKELKKSHLILSVGRGIKKFLNEYRTPVYMPVEKRKDYYFLDNSHGSEDMCIILAGYKPDLWDNVFDRVRTYADSNIDICVCSSGKKDDRLLEMCKQNGWSYLATQKNQVSDIQNIAIELHKFAKYIYKLDEDIFITKYFFENLKKRMRNNILKFEIGFVCPLINVNGYSYVRILEKLNLVEAWEKNFNDCIYSEGLHHHTDILKSPNAAIFLWGGTGVCELGDIDLLAEKFNSEADAYSLCNIRFSIGAILFTRKAWEEMGHFPVDGGTGMGADEEAICSWCMFSSRAIVVDENTIVGHLAYGPQNAVMLEYYKNNHDKFKCHDIYTE